MAKALSEDAIVGEEHAPVSGTSRFTWVIDRIDGTTNLINGTPAWTVVVAVVRDGVTECDVIHDPINRETFFATRSKSATFNGARPKLADARKISEGTVGVGYSSRVDDQGIVRLFAPLVEERAMLHRNAPGALSLAYVAAGRLLRYAEEYMNAWDCLAGQLIVAEAGGCIELLNADTMTRNGGRVAVGTSAVLDRLLDHSNRAFGQTE